MASKYNDYIEIECEVIHHTDKAALIRYNDVDFWTPFSCMHISSEKKVLNEGGTEHWLKIREWFLSKTGVL